MEKFVPKFTKGRGAITNRPGRFEGLQTVFIDDGWITTIKAKKD